ncbi:MAG: BTAD domain-containing putative transcriptional regulator, partial [Anaerolineae bacterium]|nr:BTAD domain-containing putative transcriptional regulator [Anaerolineae bacterium]
MDLTIHLLGQFQVLLNGKAITHFATDKVRALLAYLAIENQYPHRREKLAALFWPEKSESTARTNLRRALADLRANIQDSDTAPPFLLVTRKDIQLNLDHSIEIDCLLLDQLANHGCKNQQDLENCDQLLELFQGDFLEGFSLPDCGSFDEWLLTVREQYNRRMIHVLEQVIQYHQEQHKYNLALPYGRRLVTLSPWQEDSYRQLMRLLVLAGHREEALLQYDDLKTTLAEELGIEPEPATTQLMENIRNSNIANISVSRKTAVGSAFSDILPEIFEGSAELQETFAGRKEILASLHAKLSTILQTQHGSVHFIAGEAGSGKTWLGREFINQALDKHPTLVTAAGFCNAFTGTGDPYLPFREILSQLCGDFEAQLRAGTITRIYARRLWNIRSTAAKVILTYGQGLLSTIIPGYVFLNERSFQRFHFEDWYQELKAVAELRQRSKDSIQYTVLLSQLTTVLQQIAQVSPLILAIDDLHWADSGTLNLLMHLGKHLAGSPILILGAFRSEEVYGNQGDQPHPLMPILHEMQREHGNICTRLEEAPGREFIQDVLDREPHALDSDFTDYLFRITNGHALFVSELLSSLKSKGVLFKNRKGQWIESGLREFEDLPPKIEGVLALRIQTLSRQAQYLLTLASIQGDIFNAEIIAEVAGQKLKKVLQLLNAAATHEQHLIQRQQRSLDEKGQFTAYKFRHILFQKYLYDNIDLAERRYLHEQVACTLETLAVDESQVYAGQLARHFHEAGQLEKAISYYIQAGRRAKQMVGIQEATHLYETALSLNQSLFAYKEKDHQELQIQMELSLIYQFIFGVNNQHVEKSNNRIWDLCQTLDGDDLRLDALEILINSSPFINANYERWNEIETLKKKIRSEMEELPIREKIRQAWGDSYLDFRFGFFKSSIKNSKIAIRLFDEILEPKEKELLG